MTPGTNDPLQPLYDVATQWLGREPDEHERIRLAEFAVSLSSQQAADTTTPRDRASRLIDAEKRRVQSAISTMLKNLQDASQRTVFSQQTAEAATLRAVEASRSLDELRPSALRAIQPGETPTGQLLIAQIADRLGNLLRAEVDACFDKRFGRATHHASDPTVPLHAGEQDPDSGQDLPPSHANT